MIGHKSDQRSPHLTATRTPQILCFCQRASVHSPNAQGAPIRRLHGENPCCVESSSQQETRSRKSGNVGMCIRRAGKSPNRGFGSSELTVFSESMSQGSSSRKKCESRLVCA